MSVCRLVGRSVLVYWSVIISNFTSYASMGTHFSYNVSSSQLVESLYFLFNSISFCSIERNHFLRKLSPEPFGTPLSYLSIFCIGRDSGLCAQNIKCFHQCIAFSTEEISWGKIAYAYNAGSATLHEPPCLTVGWFVVGRSDSSLKGREVTLHGSYRGTCSGTESFIYLC